MREIKEMNVCEKWKLTDFGNATARVIESSKTS